MMILLIVGALGGLLMMLVGSLMFLIAAFGVSIWWGIFCIFFPPTNVLFLLVNWKAAKKAFLVWLIGLLLVLAPLIMVENFLSSMRDYHMMHFRSFNQSSSTTTTSAPAFNLPMMADPYGNADMVGPQSLAGLPALPEQKK